jgi:hypothetical protein
VSEATYLGGEVHNEPHNVLEIGTAGATFLLLSRLATGKKVSPGYGHPRDGERKRSSGARAPEFLLQNPARSRRVGAGIFVGFVPISEVPSLFDAHGSPRVKYDRIQGHRLRRSDSTGGRMDLDRTS